MYGGKQTGLRFLGATVLTTYRPVVIVVAEPWDPDDDTAFTGRLDTDGNSVLAPRPWLRHAADSWRNADLSVPAYRSVRDRHVHIFVLGESNRRLQGSRHRFQLIDLRAGEAGGLGGFTVRSTIEASRSRKYSDTTARLDSDGNSVIPPSVELLHSHDSLRNADLVVESAVQDRDRQDWEIGGSIGQRHRFILRDTRAGYSGGMRGFTVHAKPVADGRTRIKAVST